MTRPFLVTRPARRAHRIGQPFFLSGLPRDGNLVHVSTVIAGGCRRYGIFGLPDHKKLEGNSRLPLGSKRI